MSQAGTASDLPDKGVSAPARPLPAVALFGGFGGALLVGAVAALVVSLDSGGGWSDGLRWTLYAVSTTLAAVILGLIFGEPRPRTEFFAGASERYSSNSNLEQITDWLTKLLVGAGLLELGNMPAASAAIGGFLG